MSIRDDFFASKAVGALWDVAVSIKRGNPLPLDSNSVFASYADLETYVAGPLAYPGQIVAVVNVDSTGIYYLDQDLAIQEVGKIPSADNKSIEVTDGVISMYDFGKYYYKYIPEVKNEETGEVTEAAHYEKTEVSDTNVWAAGLEPKVVADGDELVIGWFEPNPTTAEGVQDQVVAVQGTVDELEETLNGEGGLVDQVEELQNEIGHAATETGDAATGLYAELDKKANAADVYTKTEVNNLVDGLEDSLIDKANSADVYNKTEVYTKSETETAIATAVNAADHLKRKIVDKYEDIQSYIDAHDDADRYIFMVPTVYAYTSESNKYDEYIVLKSVESDTIVYTIEPVGSWAVDLADYVSETELANYLKEYYSSERVDEILEDYASIAFINTTLENYYTVTQIEALLEDKIYTKEEINNLIADYYNKDYIDDQFADYYDKDAIDAVIANYYNKNTIDNKFNNVYTKEAADAQFVAQEDGKSLVSDEEIAKLETVQANAEENFIKSVNEDQFAVSEAGKLSLTSTITNALLTDSDKEKLGALVIGENNKVEISGTVNANNVQDLDEWIKKNRNDVLGLLSEANEEKLDLIENGAEKNVIASVDEEAFTITNRQLLLNAIPIEKITGLSNTINTLQSDVQSLENVLNGYEDEEGNAVEGLVSIIEGLDTKYVSIANFNSAVGNLEDLLANNTTLVNRIEEVEKTLRWQEMIE